MYLDMCKYVFDTHLSHLMYSLLSNIFYSSCRFPKCAGTDLVIFSSFWGAIWGLPRWSLRVLLSKALNLFFTESPRRGPQDFGKRQKCTPDVNLCKVLYLEAESNSWIVLFVAFLGETWRRFQWFIVFPSEFDWWFSRWIAVGRLTE